MVIIIPIKLASKISHHTVARTVHVSSFLPFPSLLSFLLFLFSKSKSNPLLTPNSLANYELCLADISPTVLPCSSSPQLSPTLSRKAWECRFHSSSLSWPWMGTRFLFQNRSSHSNLTLWLPTSLKITSRLPSVAFHRVSPFRQHDPFSQRLSEVTFMK